MPADSRRLLFLILVVVAALAGCAGRGKVETASSTSGGGSSIAIEASSYKFSPSEIRVERPGTLTLQIENVSGSEHNFTLEDPGGKVLANLALYPHKTAKANVELPGTGVYKFYCDISIHATLGMKGKIIVSQ
jgi:plastocyanin